MKRVASIARIVVGLLIFMMAVEMGARLDDVIAYGAPLWGPYGSERLYEHDQIGQRGKPGARYMKWQLNSLGYRGPELSSGRIRIVCIGASETFGLYEAAGEEYPRQLERDLNARSGKDFFEVVDVAYPGETVASTVLRIPEMIEKLHPRFALIYSSPANYIWLPWIRPTASVASPNQTSGNFGPRVADRIRIVLKSVLPERLQTWLRRRDIDSAAEQYHVMVRVPEENVLRYSSDLASLVNALRSRGVEPILVTHADAFGEHPAKPNDQLLTSWRKFYPMLAERGFIDMEQRMNDAMRNLATDQHIWLVDIAREVSPNREYFADFSHFTTLGASVMASFLADAIAAENHIDSSQRLADSRNNGQPALATHSSR